MTMPRQRSGHAAFTLVELIVVMAIIAMLVSLVLPKMRDFQSRAEATACLGNLRQIGVSTALAAQDNNNLYPIIEPRPSSPSYSEEDEAGSMFEVLGPYGVTEAMLRCRADVRRENHFATEGTSYFWSPISAEEPVVMVTVYGRRGIRVRRPSRVTLCTDFRAVHQGKMNRLYADGSVRAR